MATYKCKTCSKDVSERGRMPATGTCGTCRGIGPKFVNELKRTNEVKPHIVPTAKPDFSVFEYNKERIKFYREVLDEVERQNELWQGEKMFIDLLDKELKCRNEQ